MRFPKKIFRAVLSGCLGARVSPEAAARRASVVCFRYIFQNDRLLLAKFQPTPVSVDKAIISPENDVVNKPQVVFSYLFAGLACGCTVFLLFSEIKLRKNDPAEYQYAPRDTDR